jgi:hypothetical protein
MSTAALCPYCLAELPSFVVIPVHHTCQVCEKAIPALYLSKGIRQSGFGGSVRTDVVGCVGKRGNGKTTLLMSLIATMINDPDAILRAGGYRTPNSSGSGPSLGTYAPGGDDASDNALTWANTAYIGFAQHGTLPPATQVGGATPIPFYLAGHPGWGRRNLFLFDAAGESFDVAYRAVRNASFLARSQVVWVVVSMSEKDRSGSSAGGLGQTLWGLLDNCENAMAEIRAEKGWPTRPQSLLVIFQKADARGDVVPALDQVLANDENSTLEMRQETSELLGEWVKDEARRYGGSSSARLGDRFARVEFCAVSATGADVSGEQMSVRPRPRRVLDPLLWTWDLVNDLEISKTARAAKSSNHTRPPQPASQDGTKRRWFSRK